MSPLEDDMANALGMLKQPTQAAGLGPLIAALAKAQGAFPRIGKDKSAQIQTRSGSSYRYSYADLATILEAIRKPLADNALAVWQCVNRRDEMVCVTTVLGHSSGECLSSELTMPIGDVHDPRSVASAITYTRRYGLVGLVGIAAADEDDDADAAQPQHSAATKPREDRPLAPDGFRYLDDYRFENGWHHARIHHADAQGGAIEYKTKIESLGALACQAFQDGIPVQIEGKPGNGKDAWWLNKIILWKPELTRGAAGLPAATDPDDIPF